MGFRVFWLVLAAGLLIHATPAQTDAGENLTDASEIDASACPDSDCGAVLSANEPDEFNATIMHSREMIAFAFAGLGLLAFGLFYFGGSKKEP